MHLEMSSVYFRNEQLVRGSAREEARGEEGLHSLGRKQTMATKKGQWGGAGIGSPERPGGSQAAPRCTAAEDVFRVIKGSRQ